MKNSADQNAIQNEIENVTEKDQGTGSENPDTLSEAGNDDDIRTFYSREILRIDAK